MMNLKLDIMGVKMNIDYGSVAPPDAKPIVVTFHQKPNNQTEFNIHSNPDNLPDAAIRMIVRTVHETLIRMARDVPSPLYIVVEK